MPQIKSDEYLYSTARFRAKAAKLPDRELLIRLTEASTVDECVRQLADNGIVIDRDISGNLLIEPSLDRYLTECFAEVAHSLPDPAMVDIFRYPYDAHNVKVLLKSRVRGTNPFPLLMGMGTVSPENAELAVREGNYERFSQEISVSIPKAIALFTQTNDPQLLDAVVDAACYADMLARARAYGDFLVTAVQTKIDTINILTALRILRIGGYAPSFYSQHFISGGKLSDEAMLKAFEEGESALIGLLAHSPYSALADAFAGKEKVRLSEWESACDALYRRGIHQANSSLTGADTIFAFLVDRETEVKNVRILLTSKQASLPPQRIKNLLGGM